MLSLSLTFIEAWLLAALAMGMTDRDRGGGYNMGGDTIARIIYGAVFALFFGLLVPDLALQTGHIITHGWVFVMAFLSLIIVGNATYMSFGDGTFVQKGGPVDHLIGLIAHWKDTDSVPVRRWKAALGIAIGEAIRAALIFSGPGLSDHRFFLAIPLLAALVPLARYLGRASWMPEQIFAYRDGTGKLIAAVDGGVANGEALRGFAYGFGLGLIAAIHAL